MGESPAQPDKGGAVQRLITRMVILPYDTKSKSRNADFISIAAERQSATLGAKGPVKLKNPPAVRPVNPKNLSHLNLLNSMNVLVLACHPAKIT